MLFRSDICKYTGLTYSNDFWNYYEFKRVQGDIQIRSRGQRVKRIRPLARKRIHSDLTCQIDASATMREANQLFGYPTRYADVLLEPWWKPAIASVWRKLRQGMVYYR